MRRLHSALGAFAVVLGAVSACVAVRYPGSEIIGTFDFTAIVPDAGTPAPPGTCTFGEMPIQDFTFTGTFSRNPDGKTFFTLNGIDRAATFDGQVITSSESASREFDECGCPGGTVVDETLTVALLSRSQTDALSDPSHCPANPLDGGVPPVGGSITGPGSTGSSFDAVLACGTLVDNVVVSDTCPPPPDGGVCPNCGVSYPLQGVRR